MLERVVGLGEQGGSGKGCAHALIPPDLRGFLVAGAAVVVMLGEGSLLTRV